MVHRGPDDEGVHVDQKTGVSLGARRLSIIDVAGGHQPLSNEDGSVWAVLNGEIYNHRELQERLAARGHRLRSRSDTEVLVHLYEDFADELVHALEGMFAFAIWDACRQRLVVARDRFGEKPLFYSLTDGALVLASELTALRRGIAADPELDAEAIDAFYVYGYVPAPRSVVRDVRQLLPGCLMTWEQRTGNASTRRYWQPPLFSSSSVAQMDEVAEVEAVLERALRARMISDMPLGIFLSGGLDSTLVAALAARCSQRPVKTFTVGYDSGSVSEAKPARRVARAIGSDHHEVVITRSEVPTLVSEVLRGIDHPIADPALVALHAVAAAARREITVAVGGEGADELFGGYPRYRWLGRAETLRAMLPSAVASGISRAMRRIDKPTAARLGDVLAPVMTASRHVNWVTFNRRDARAAIYGSRLLSQGLHRAAPEMHVVQLIPWGLPLACAFMHLDQVRWLPDDVLQKADRATMMASLEMRTPYLSRELVELAAAIPVSEHLRGGGKHVLRQVLTRTGLGLGRIQAKRAFRVPLAEWLRGPLDALVDEQLASSCAYREGWFDPDGARTLWERHRRGEADNSALLWPVVSFACWLDSWREQ